MIDNMLKEGKKMDNLQIGTIQMMTVKRTIDTGYVLQKGTEEVLMHTRETEGTLEVDAAVDVFLYTDKNDQVVATMKIPSIVLGAYGWATVVEVVPNLGVFVDIGTTKEMLVSVDDLPLFEEVWPQVDDKIYVTLGKDRKGRLLAIPASEEILEDCFEMAYDVELNERVSGRIYLTSKEGSALITEEGYRAFVHYTERGHEPRLGELVSGRIIEVKENGTLNVSLMPMKHERLDDDAEAILMYLQEHGGKMPYGDKSSPETIQKNFQMSKSAFKRALGRLMKYKKVKQADGQTFLIDKK